MELTTGRPKSNDGRPEIEVRTYDFLDKTGIAYHTLSHSEVEAYTMETCATLESTLGAQIVKTLFLGNRQQTDFYLLIMPGDKPFKTKFLSSQLGCARLSFADEEHMVSMLGMHPGSASPLGLFNDVEHKIRMVIDKDLMERDTLGFVPCADTASVRMPRTDFTDKFLPATGHDYTVVELAVE